MKITVSGKQMTVRQSLKDLTVKKLEKFDRYFGDDAETIVSYSCRHGLQYIEVTILYNGTIFRSEEGAETFQNAIDEAVESLERQMRKNKTRLEKRLRTEIGFRDVERVAIGPSVLTNTGPLAMAVAYYGTPRD